MRRQEFHQTIAALAAASLIPSCAAEAPSVPPAPLGEAPTFARARVAIERTISRDAANPKIESVALPRLYHHGKRVKRSVVLLHGFTNCPEQFDVLARAIHARGANVYVPRIPFHGYADRLTHALAQLTIGDMERCALDAYANARGLGETVAVMGLSLGGTMALWLAQTQPVDVVVPIAPFLMPISLSRWLGNAVMHGLAMLPDMYWWWDPRLKAAIRPPYAYPGFSTHALAQIAFLGDIVFALARQHAPRARACVLVTNKDESAVNDGVTAQLYARWKEHGAKYGHVVLSHLGTPRHDIIDPTTFPEARTLVYPTLERLAFTP